MTTQRTSTDAWLGHIRVLAEHIGPRGPATAAERRASYYCQRVLSELGLDPRVERFPGARSIFHPHLVAAGGYLVAFSMYPIGEWGAVGAAVLSVLTLTSQLAELSFRGNPLRWPIPKGSSQNVVATVEPANRHRQDIILFGHVDTQRTPVMFQSRRGLVAFVVFTVVAALVFAAQAVLYVIGALADWSWIWPATIPAAVSAVVLGALCLHAEQTPFTAGANDNASGAGLVLTLAERLKSEPLGHSRVWLVCTGCEESQHYGARYFLNRHREQFHRPLAIAFEMLGCAGPAWLAREGVVVPFRADYDLLLIARDVGDRFPQFGAREATVTGGNTEMADARIAGIPAIALVGLDADGYAPHWHQPGDTVDKIDPDVLERALGYTWAYLRELDDRLTAIVE